MEVKTQGKFIRVSPVKARSVADVVRGKKASESLVILKFMPHKAAKIISKVIKTAIADAEHNFYLDSKDLVINKITVDKGPYFKRWRPAAKGMSKPIEKKTSYITVVVSGETKLTKIKKETTEQKEEPVKDEQKTKKDEAFTHEDKKLSPRSMEEKGHKGFFRRKTG